MVRANEDFGPLRSRFQDDELAETELGRRLFRTKAGPDASPYPSRGANVYYVDWLRDLSYTETPGVQSLSIGGTAGAGYVYQLAEGPQGDADFLVEASIGLAFKMGAQWFTDSARLQVVEGVLDGALSPASSAKDGPATATLSLWIPSSGDFIDSGDNVTVTNRMTETPEIEAGTWLVALKVNGEFRPIAADCEPTTIT